MEKGAEVDYHDPLVPSLPPMRHYNYDMQSVKLTKENIAEYDLVILSTDHSSFDYKLIAEYSNIIVDTRNSFQSRSIESENIFNAWYA